MRQTFLRMDPIDNVVIVLTQMEPGHRIEIDDRVAEVQETIPVGHKVAIREILNGDYVIKYGEPIGRATVSIGVGQLVHVHNVYDITEDVYLENRKDLGL